MELEYMGSFETSVRKPWNIESTLFFTREAQCGIDLRIQKVNRTA